MKTRRDILSSSARLTALLAGAGLWPSLVQAQSGATWNRNAFESKTVAELVKALGVGRPVESGEVTLTAPDIAENGASVPIGVATTLPTARRLLLLVEKNPSVLSALFEVSESIEAAFSTRVKMAQSSDVYAVVLTSDSKVLFARKDVTVTLGGCGS